MEQLKIIGTEEGALVLATESGDRFSLAIDDALRSHLRVTRRAPEARGKSRAVPREVQAHIRAGLSADEVAELLDVRVDDVRRYEGPVLAEREHIVGQALSMPVLLGAELEPDAQPTFGAAVRAKLVEAGATGQRWTSWKEESGWIVKLEFTAGEVDHDARWRFDPKRSSLSPQNSDATQLSRQGSLPEGLIPRLRALDTDSGKDASRPDGVTSGPRRAPEPAADMPAPEPVAPTTAAVEEAAINRAADQPTTSAETADLLEALRRRRGQREPMPRPQTPVAGEEPSSSPHALVDSREQGHEKDRPKPVTQSAPRTVNAEPSASASRRRGARPSMPSWDEIVFGARSEDA